MTGSLIKFHEKISFYYKGKFVSKNKVFVYLVNAEKPYMNIKDNYTLTTISSYYIDEMYNLNTY